MKTRTIKMATPAAMLSASKASKTNNIFFYIFRI